MKLISAIALSIFLVFNPVHSAPKSMEMIFLTAQKITSLLELINLEEKSKTKLAINDMDKCEPMGDGCFHPQYGYIEKTPENGKSKLILEERELELKTFNATDVQLVNCDKGNYFDIFCGRAKNNSNNANIEVWFDVSSSLRTVDYNKDADQCARRAFMNKVQASCPGKVQFSIFNTSLKEVGDHSGACLAYGTNDQKRLLKWLEDSQAKHLLIVTDVDEMSTEIQEFLSKNGVKIMGDGVKPFTSSDLIVYANEFIKRCK